LGSILEPVAQNGANDSDGDEAFIAAQQAASNRRASSLKGRTVKKGGGFQSMGLDATLLKAITRKGFSVPTPIQRKTIPLLLDGDDVVGMARTGSGKTAAFVIPMIQKLKAHSAKVGARALILSPSRELAIQTLKVVKELGRGSDLRTVLLVGGDSLEDQFGTITSNPDIIVATPGRFLHLKVEMKLDLSTVEYVVFDEADRLFEMGFAVQLTEILHGLSSSRQTLLFSATLPKSLVDFARAGLQEPKLVRLDADTKVSQDLESAFFTVKSADKEGALLQIMQDVIRMPATSKQPKPDGDDQKSKKRKTVSNRGNTDSPSEHSTIVFAATKHRVEYLAALLQWVGYPVSFVYGSLDQTARKRQIQSFRDGTSTILIVTDVAARGIDIPLLSNVINYDFPSQPKVFVHRVGRTARAGKRGWSYSLVQDSDVPYLLDLQLFLSRRLVVGYSSDEHVNFAKDIVLGCLPRTKASSCCEWVSKIVEDSVDISTLQSVAEKGEKLYTRTRNAASLQSVKRAKEVLSGGSITEINRLFADDAEIAAFSSGRQDLLTRLRNYRPSETIFEIGKRGVVDETVSQIRKARSHLDALKSTSNTTENAIAQPLTDGTKDKDQPPEDVNAADSASDADSDELEVTFSQGNSKGNGAAPWKESEHFMSYTPRLTSTVDESAYGVHTGSSANSREPRFLLAVQDASLDLLNDEGARGFAQPMRAGTRMRWDKKGKKYVSTANDEDGSRGGGKLVRGESGLKIAASLRSGRFDRWRKANNVERLPRVGEAEDKRGLKGPGDARGRYKHKMEKAPKEADKYRDDYEVRKKRVAAAKEKGVGRFKDGGAKSELRGMDGVRKQRQLKERKRLRNGRPSKRKKS
jgi:ATP-dependent RNA helicase DDX54/DBP10